jgi:hypothetical protein
MGTEGHCRQGQALLALGLAQRLHGLQGARNPQGQDRERERAPAAEDQQDLATLLARRESLLRLVDPTALGDFRWMAFRRGPAGSGGEPAVPLFLREPGLGSPAAAAIPDAPPDRKGRSSPPGGSPSPP